MSADSYVFSIAEQTAFIIKKSEENVTLYSLKNQFYEKFGTRKDSYQRFCKALKSVLDSNPERRWMQEIIRQTEYNMETGQWKNNPFTRGQLQPTPGPSTSQRTGSRINSAGSSGLLGAPRPSPRVPSTTSSRQNGSAQYRVVSNGSVSRSGPLRESGTSSSAAGSSGEAYQRSPASVNGTPNLTRRTGTAPVPEAVNTPIPIGNQRNGRPPIGGGGPATTSAVSNSALNSKTNGNQEISRNTKPTYGSSADPALPQSSRASEFTLSRRPVERDNDVRSPTVKSEPALRAEKGVQNGDSVNRDRLSTSATVPAVPQSSRAPIVGLRLPRRPVEEDTDIAGSSRTVVSVHQQSPAARKGTPDVIISPSLTRRIRTVPVPATCPSDSGQIGNSLNGSLPSTSAAPQSSRAPEFRLSKQPVEEDTGARSITESLTPASRTEQSVPATVNRSPIVTIPPNPTRRNEKAPVSVSNQSNKSSFSNGVAPATSAPTAEPAENKKKRRLNLTFSSVEMEKEIRAWRPSGNPGAAVNGTPSTVISPNLAVRNWTAPVSLPARSQPNGTPQKGGSAPGTSKSAEPTSSSSSHRVVMNLEKDAPPSKSNGVKEASLNSKPAKYSFSNYQQQWDEAEKRKPAVSLQEAMKSSPIPSNDVSRDVSKDSPFVINSVQIAPALNPARHSSNPNPVLHSPPSNAEPELNDNIETNSAESSDLPMDQDDDVTGSVAQTIPSLSGTRRNVPQNEGAPGTSSKPPAQYPGHSSDRDPVPQSPPSNGELELNDNIEKSSAGRSGSCLEQEGSSDDMLAQTIPNSSRKRQQVDFLPAFVRSHPKGVPQNKSVAGSSSKPPAQYPGHSTKPGPVPHSPASNAKPGLNEIIKINSAESSDLPMDQEGSADDMLAQTIPSSFRKRLDVDSSPEFVRSYSKEVPHNECAPGTPSKASSSRHHVDPESATSSPTRNAEPELNENNSDGNSETPLKPADDQRSATRNIPSSTNSPTFVVPKVATKRSNPLKRPAKDESGDRNSSSPSRGAGKRKVTKAREFTPYEDRKGKYETVERSMEGMLDKLREPSVLTSRESSPDPHAFMGPVPGPPPAKRGRGRPPKNQNVQLPSPIIVTATMPTASQEKHREPSEDSCMPSSSSVTQAIAEDVTDRAAKGEKGAKEDLKMGNMRRAPASVEVPSRNPVLAEDSLNRSSTSTAVPIVSLHGAKKPSSILSNEESRPSPFLIDSDDIAPNPAGQRLQKSFLPAFVRSQLKGLPQNEGAPGSSSKPPIQYPGHSSNPDPVPHSPPSNAEPELNDNIDARSSDSSLEQEGSADNMLAQTIPNSSRKLQNVDFSSVFVRSQPKEGPQNGGVPGSSSKSAESTTSSSSHRVVINHEKDAPISKSNGVEEASRHSSNSDPVPKPKLPRLPPPQTDNNSTGNCEFPDKQEQPAGIPGPSSPPTYAVPTVPPNRSNPLKRPAEEDSEDTSSSKLRKPSASTSHGLKPLPGPPPAKKGTVRPRPPTGIVTAPAPQDEPREPSEDTCMPSCSSVAPATARNRALEKARAVKAAKKDLKVGDKRRGRNPEIAPVQKAPQNYILVEDPLNRPSTSSRHAEPIIQIGGHREEIYRIFGREEQESSNNQEVVERGPPSAHQRRQSAKNPPKTLKTPSTRRTSARKAGAPVSEDLVIFLQKMTLIVIEPISLKVLAALYWVQSPYVYEQDPNEEVDEIQEEIEHILNSMPNLDFDANSKAMIQYMTQAPVPKKLFDQISEGVPGTLYLDHERKIVQYRTDSIAFTRGACVDLEEWDPEEMEEMMMFVFNEAKENRELTLNDVCEMYQQSGFNTELRATEDVRIKVIACVTCATPSTYNFIDIAAWLVIHFKIPPMDQLKRVILTDGEFQLNNKGYLSFYKRDQFEAGKVNDSRNPVYHKDWENLKVVMQGFYGGMEKEELEFLKDLMNEVDSIHQVKMAELTDVETVDITAVRSSLSTAMRIVRREATEGSTDEHSICVVKVLRILLATANVLTGSMAKEVQLMMQKVVKQYKIHPEKIPQEMVLKALRVVMNVQNV